MDKGNKSEIDLEALSVAEVASITGQPLRIGELWKEQTVMLVFIRHFG